LILINKIFKAVNDGNLTEPFTLNDLRNWIENHNIVNDSRGDKYTESSISAILPNSDIKNQPTSNRNTKVLQSSINDNGLTQYSFLTIT